jgi:hypothetical protein
MMIAAIVTGCSTAPSPIERATLARFFLESTDGAGARTILPQSEVEINVSMKPVFTEFDILGVDVIETEFGKGLSFQFTPAARRDLYRLSVENLGRRLVLTIDGKPMGAHRIERPIEDGALLIFVETPDEALDGLQTALRKTSADYQRAARKL